VVVSGDTGLCGDVMVKFAANADILLHEVIDLAAIEANIAARRDGTNSLSGQQEALMTHMREDHTTAEEVGRVANAAAVKMLVLTHLVPGTLDQRTRRPERVTDRVPMASGLVPLPRR
jgi:ribonuclease BN (tRNA processing enzyme)